MLRRYAVVALAVAFPLHFAWEWLQCQPYFVHQAIPPTATSMLMATVGDLALTIAAYLAVAVLNGLQWGLHRWNAWGIVILESVAIALAIAVESFALATGRWSYTDAVPFMPGTRVSLLPVLQLVLLLPLTFLLARFLTARFSPPPGSQARGPQP